MTILKIDGVIDKYSCRFIFILDRDVDKDFLTYARHIRDEDVMYDKDTMIAAIIRVIEDYKNTYGDIEAEYMMFNKKYADVNEFVYAIIKQHDYMLAISGQSNVFVERY